MAQLLWYAAWRQPAFRARLKERNLVAQLKARDEEIGRWYAIRGGKVTSGGGLRADADVTIYTPDPNQETMFELPRFVIKSGRVIVDGTDLSKLSESQLVRYRAEKVGFVFQQFHLVPYLTALGQAAERDKQAARLIAEMDPATKLYGHPPAYYDQNLVMFSRCWSEHRFRFGRDGELKVTWKNS